MMHKLIFSVLSVVYFIDGKRVCPPAGLCTHSAAEELTAILSGPLKQLFDPVTSPKNTEQLIEGIKKSLEDINDVIECSASCLGGFGAPSCFGKLLKQGQGIKDDLVSILGTPLPKERRNKLKISVQSLRHLIIDVGVCYPLLAPVTGALVSFIDTFVLV